MIRGPDPSWISWSAPLLVRLRDAFFRRVFKGDTGTTPAEFRRKFGNLA